MQQVPTPLFQALRGLQGLQDPLERQALLAQLALILPLLVLQDLRERLGLQVQRVLQALTQQ